jgi:hypothetical protein
MKMTIYLIGIGSKVIVPITSNKINGQIDVMPKNKGKWRKNENGQNVSAFIGFHKFVTILYTMFC